MTAASEGPERRDQRDGEQDVGEGHHGVENAGRSALSSPAEEAG